jgi:hypothetical protein
MRKQAFSQSLLFLLGSFFFLSAAFTPIKTLIAVIPVIKRSILYIVSVMRNDEKLSIIHSCPVQFAILR